MSELAVAVKGLIVMSEIVRRLSHAGIFLGGLAVCLMFLAFANALGNGSKADERVYIPEYLLDSPQAPHCLFEVDIGAPNTIKRRDVFKRFVDGYINQDRRSQRRLVVLGVQFSTFHRFHLLDLESCSHSYKAVMHLVTNSGLPLSLSRNENDAHPLLGYVGEEGTSSTDTASFIHFRSKGDIGQCLVQMKSRKPNDIEFAGRWSERIGAIAQRYHPPIADMGGYNNVLYVLFSRECAEKASVLNIIFALAGQNKDARQEMNIDLYPDAHLFLNAFAHEPAVVIPPQQ